MFLEEASGDASTKPLQASDTPRKTEKNEGTAPSFLQQAPGSYAGIVDPQMIQGKLAMANQGLPPYGMDCCPCLANEEDYRIYPPGF